MPINILTAIFSRLIGRNIKKRTKKKRKTPSLKKVKSLSPISKFNPEIFDDSYFNTVYFPQIKKIDRETGIEEKFGGRKPFFKKGESWPITNYNDPLVFICQFKDPRKNNNNLIRVFLDKELMEWEELEDYNGFPIYKGKPYITKINLDRYQDNQDKTITFPETYIEEETLRIFENQRKFKINLETKNQIRKELEREYIMPCHKITSWKKDKELKYYEEIYLKLYGKSNSVNSINEELYHKYEKSKFAPSVGIKVGGTPQATQDEEIVKDFQLLQLSQTTYAPFEWADGGIAHINDKLELYFDSN